MKKINLITYLALFAFTACKTNLPYTESMKVDLKQMYTNDQKAQVYDLKKVERKSYSDSMENEFNLLCKKNTKVIKQYFKEYGFPGIKENGEDTSIRFWLITQHSDNDVAFQQKVLKAMKTALKHNNCIPRNYAFLYDRVQKNLNKLQLYGTQMVWDSLGKHSPYMVKDPDNLNNRRKAMGLEKMEDYLKGFNH